MTWRIHSWSREAKVGTVASAHLGPWGFGPEQNPFATHDFAVGEEVLVEVDRTRSGGVVRSVIAARQRQPEGTEHPAFAELNASRPGDMYVQEQTATTLCFWLGHCCERCSASWWLVSFHDPAVVHGLEDDTDLDDSFLRRAAPAELDERGVEVPPGCEAYCIVTNHGSGRDGACVLVVARGVSVEHRTRPASPRS